MRPKTKKHSEKRNQKKARRSPAYWIGLGTVMGSLMVSTIAGGKTVAYARAYRAASWGITVQPAQSDVVRFDIPPGPMDTVLDAFQKAAGIRFAFAKETIRDVSSPGVSGLFTAEEGLRKLLAGTGVNFAFSSRDLVTLDLQGPDEAVEVVGTITPSSIKYSEPLRDTPQTIHVIPKAVIEEQGATTLRDVLRNVPGLTITAGEGGTPAGDNLTLRGFSARNDIFIDGVRDISPQSRDPFNIEQVEVVKGPGSAFTGRGSSGGTINLVSKAPNPRRFYGGTLNFGTDATKRVTADINLPLDDRIYFRLNFLAHDSDVAGRDAVENQRWGIAPTVTLGLGPGDNLTLSYFKLKQDNLSDYGIPWVPVTHNVLVAFRDRPAPVPRDTFYGLTSRDFEKLNSDLGTIRYEHVGESLTITNQFRFDRSTRDSMATPPRFASNDTTVINREMRSWITEDRIWDNQTDLKATFSTGPVGHTLVTGLDLAIERNIRKVRTAPAMTTTLFNPNPDDVYTGTITLSPLVGDVTGESIAAYAFDNVRFHRKFELNGGLRWDYFEVDGVNTIAQPVNRIDRMLSGRVGIVYKPIEAASVYAAYGTSLNPSLEGLSYNVANTVIGPEETYTCEIGAKWDLFSSRLLLAGAVFRVDKDNARTPGVNPGDPPQVLEGRQRVKGIEMSATGSITRDWSVLAGYTYLLGRILSSNVPAEVGMTIQNTPKNSFNIWSTYTIRKLTFGGGTRFVDSRFGNNINTRRVDSYWTVDAMASYPVSRYMDLRLNLYNLTNTYYFDRLGGGHLVPGPGRTASVSLGFRH
jgi:catecholate siderophore receptor